MNRIQKISQDLLTSRLKLQMGLDPSVPMKAHQVYEMWQQLKRERARQEQSSFESHMSDSESWFRMISTE